MPQNLRQQRRWAKLKVASDEYGMSVPELFRLAVSDEVKASHRLKPGKKRGTWLINCADLENYIESFRPGGSRHRKEERREPASSSATSPLASERARKKYAERSGLQK